MEKGDVPCENSLLRQVSSLVRRLPAIESGDVPCESSLLRQASRPVRRLPAIETGKFQDDFLMISRPDEWEKAPLPNKYFVQFFGTKEIIWSPISMASDGFTDKNAVFRKLKTKSENKSCFDCNAKNPTWASVPYEIFLCIDCSATYCYLIHLRFLQGC